MQLKCIFILFLGQCRSSCINQLTLVAVIDVILFFLYSFTVTHKAMIKEKIYIFCYLIFFFTVLVHKTNQDIANNA